MGGALSQAVCPRTCSCRACADPQHVYPVRLVRGHNSIWGGSEAGAQMWTGSIRFAAPHLPTLSSSTASLGIPPVLQQVQFAEARGATNVREREPLERAASLWSVDVESLLTALTEKQTALYTTPLTSAQAMDCRDALCKALYNGVYPPPPFSPSQTTPLTAGVT